MKYNELTWGQAVWKTIKLDTGPKTADDFCKVFKQNGCKIGDYGKNILCKPAFTVGKTETEVDLVVVSVAELDFKDGATQKDIYKRALELGLYVCPPEVGPQLRLQYKDQPMGEWLFIGMEPIPDSFGRPIIFNVGHDNYGFWLHGLNSYPDFFWGGSFRWVFARSQVA